MTLDVVLETAAIAGGAAGVVAVYFAWSSDHRAARSAANAADSAQRSADAAEQTAQLEEERDARERVNWVVEQERDGRFSVVVNVGYDTAYGVIVEIPDGRDRSGIKEVGPFDMEPGQSHAFEVDWPAVTGAFPQIKVTWHLEPAPGDDPRSKYLSLRHPMRSVNRELFSIDRDA